MYGSLVISSIEGRWPSSAASRSHIAVSGSIGPRDRYSAIPSMNQSGGLTLTSVCTPAPGRPRLYTSYWNWCTISCCSTCSNSAYDPVKGMTRSEEHTSELQSRLHLVCRLLLEKKKKEKASHSYDSESQTLPPV